MPTWHCQGLRVALPATHFAAQKCLFTVHLLFCPFLLPVQLPMHFFVVSRHAELIVWPLPVPLGSALLKPFSFFRFRLCLSILSPLDLLSMVSIILFGLFYQQSFALPFFFHIHYPLWSFLSAIVCTFIFLPHFCFSFSAWFGMYDGFLLFMHKKTKRFELFAHKSCLLFVFGLVRDV